MISSAAGDLIKQLLDVRKHHTQYMKVDHKKASE